MKKKLFILFTAIVAISCKKFEKTPELNFDVTTSKTTYKVGENVDFQITGGDAFQISFYSGKVGNAYAFKDTKRVDALKELNFSFESHNATTNSVVPTLLISTDFNGVYNYENVSKATWVDMTNKFTFGPPAVYGEAWTSSSTQDISSFTQKGKPFYIAYRCIVPAGVTAATSWRTRNHVLNGISLYGTSTSLATFKTMGWTQVKKNPLATSNSTVSEAIMLIATPTSTSPYYKLEYEEWGISKKFQVDEIDLGVDYATSIKQYVDLPISNYSFTYDKPGTYTVTFIASNATANNNNKVVKEMQITVTP